MSGPRGLFRYQLTTVGLSNSPICFVECDESVLLATIAGVANSQATIPGVNSRFRFVIPVAPAGRGKIVRARLAELEFTGELPPGRTSKLSWVPVFRVSTFSAWVEGSAGTWQGLPVRVRRRLQGSPTTQGLR